MNYIFYKITLRDKPDFVYVGHTKNFSNRKYCHKWRLNNNNQYLLYKTISENGGWDCVEMYPIEEMICENRIQALIRERYWYDTFHANLNTLHPILSDVERKNYDKERSIIFRETNQEYIKGYKKNWYEDNKERLSDKNKEKIICECGIEYTKSNKSRHFKSKRHIEFEGLKKT